VARPLLPRATASTPPLHPLRRQGATRILSFSLALVLKRVQHGHEKTSLSDGDDVVTVVYVKIIHGVVFLADIIDGVVFLV
jgi:hypothetical protein